MAPTPESELTLAQAHDEAERLTDNIVGARDAYYGRDAEIVDDATYDGWMRRLEHLEALYPELQGQDSPTLASVRPSRRCSPPSSTPNAC